MPTSASRRNSRWPSPRSRSPAPSCSPSSSSAGRCAAPPAPSPARPSGTSDDLPGRPALSVHGLSKRSGPGSRFENVTFDVGYGEVFGLRRVAERASDGIDGVAGGLDAACGARPDLRAVPETARVVQVPAHGPARCPPPVPQRGQLTDLHAHMPLIWAALLSNRAWQPRPHAPVTPLLWPVARLTDLYRVVVRGTCRRCPRPYRLLRGAAPTTDRESV